MAHKKDSSEEKQQDHSSTSRGQADTKKQKPALANQTDMGDQPAHNVTGDQPTKTPASTSQKKQQDPSLVHSNSTADVTGNSPFTTKGGRIDSAGVAGGGKGEDSDGPGEPTKSQSPHTSDE